MLKTELEPSSGLTRIWGHLMFSRTRSGDCVSLLQRGWSQKTVVTKLRKIYFRFKIFKEIAFRQGLWEQR